MLSAVCSSASLLSGSGPLTAALPCSGSDPGLIKSRGPLPWSPRWTSLPKGRLTLPFCGPPFSTQKSLLEPCYTAQHNVRVAKGKWSRSVVFDSATPRTVTYQAPLSMGFCRQEYWSGLPFPSPGNLPDPGIEPGSPEMQADSLWSEPPGKPPRCMT